MKHFDTQFKQREFDGKWEKIIKVLDHENTYVFNGPTGKETKFVPMKWITAGVYDYMMVIE